MSAIRRRSWVSAISRPVRSSSSGSARARASTPAPRFRPGSPSPSGSRGSRGRRSPCCSRVEARTEAIASALVEGLVVGTRGPDLRKSEPARHPFGPCRSSSLPRPTASHLERAVRRGQIVGEAINLARDLVNTPPVREDPDRARRTDPPQSRAPPGSKSMSGTSNGSATSGSADSWASPPAPTSRPPSSGSAYRKGGAAPTLALVGKGVTFDSGGLSLKPSASMEDMKCDMTGAAVVVATIQAVARLELPVNVVGYAALTENMTGGRAMKLGDVLTIRNGKTVEVLNTDAEGRLILADVLSFAVEEKPWRILDLATLTGACMVALGPKVAGLFSNDDAFSQDVLAACRADRRACLAAAARRRLQGAAQEQRRRPQECRRQVGRRDHRRQVPRDIRRRDALGPPRHRRPELGRRRLRHARRRRNRLLRAHPGRTSSSRCSAHERPEHPVRRLLSSGSDRDVADTRINRRGRGANRAGTRSDGC